MKRIAIVIAKWLAIVVATPVVVLLVAIAVYDLIAIRPCLPQVEAILAAADPLDADPPARIRAYIDAESGGPDVYAARLATFRIHPEWRNAHVRRALWQCLLPLHLDETQVYGLYATLAWNGTDQGMSRFAHREFGKSLDELSPHEAATTVAVTRAPSLYLRDRERLAKRASLLMQRAAQAADPVAPPASGPTDPASE